MNFKHFLQIPPDVTVKFNEETSGVKYRREKKQKPINFEFKFTFDICDLFDIMNLKRFYYK